MDKIKFSEVKLDDRIRRDYGNVDELAESLLTYGFIHPPAIDQNKTLVAGGRRWAALTKIIEKKCNFQIQQIHTDIARLIQTGELELGVHYTFKPTISIDHLGEMELEENIRRKQMSWQEECIGIAKVHRLKKHNAALNSESWGDRQTAELFKISKGKVSYVLHIADRLGDEKSPLWLCDSITDAIQKLAAIKLEEMNREIARQSVSQVKSNVNQLSSQYTDKSRANQDFFVQVPREVDLAAEFAAFTGQPAASVPSAGEASPSSVPIVAGSDASGASPVLPSAPEKTIIELSKNLFNCAPEEVIGKLHGKKIDVLFLYTTTKVDKELLDLVKPDGWVVSMTDTIFPVDNEVLEWQDHELIYVNTSKQPNKTPLISFTNNYRKIWLGRGPKAKLTEVQGSSVWLGNSDAEKVLFGEDDSVLPDGLLSWILKAIAKPGQFLVCPSVGSGSLIRTCIKSGVKFRCASFNKDQYDRAFKIASQTYTQIFPNVEVV